MNNTVRTAWTARDEAALAELQARKAQVMAQNRKPLMDLMSTFSIDLDLVSGRAEFNEHIVDWMIANSEALRDALKPFDSMSRGGGQA